MSALSVNTILKAKKAYLIQLAKENNVEVEGKDVVAYQEALINFINNEQVEKSIMSDDSASSSDASDVDQRESSPKRRNTGRRDDNTRMIAALYSQVSDLTAQVSSLNDMVERNVHSGESSMPLRLKHTMIAKKVCALPSCGDLTPVQETLRRIGESLEKAVIFYLSHQVEAKDYASIFSPLCVRVMELLIVNAFSHMVPFLNHLRATVDTKARVIMEKWFADISGVEYDDDTQLALCSLEAIIPKAVTELAKELHIRVTPQDLLNKKRNRNKPNRPNSPAQEGKDKGAGRRRD